jgi:hypothetical protein
MSIRDPPKKEKRAAAGKATAPTQQGRLKPTGVTGERGLCRNDPSAQGGAPT